MRTIDELEIMRATAETGIQQMMIETLELRHLLDIARAAKRFSENRREVDPGFITLAQTLSRAYDDGLFGRSGESKTKGGGDVDN